MEVEIYTLWEWEIQMDGQTGGQTQQQPVSQTQLCQPFNQSSLRTGQVGWQCVVAMQANGG